MTARFAVTVLWLCGCAHAEVPPTPAPVAAPPPPIVAAPLGSSDGGFDQSVARLGTREFAAPYAEVLEATVGALRSEGYGIAAQNGRTGLIRTERHVVSRFDHTELQSGGWGSAPTAVGYTVVISRQYSVTIHSRDAQHTIVVARPRLFSGDTEVAPTAIDAPGGERDAWNKLFHEIGELL